jgi:hypothetical protein
MGEDTVQTDAGPSRRPESLPVAHRLEADA